MDRWHEPAFREGDTLRAIVQDRYGSADVLSLADIDRPVPGSGEVLLRVHAASVFIGDWHVMAGIPYLGRLAFGLRAPKPRVRGQDVAGVVEAIGDGVTRLAVGDEVFGTCNGAFADYAIAREDKMAPMPSNLTPEQATTVPIAGCTALQALRDQGDVQSGQTVLIIGAAGGVGSFAVQIAKAFGAKVTGVCSTGQLEAVRSIGADEVVDYTQEDVTASGKRYDLIIDIAGARPVSQLRRALMPRGTLVLLGAEGGGRWFGRLGRQLAAQLRSPLVGQTFKGFIGRSTLDDLIELTRLIEAGKITPLIGRRYPLGEVPQAIRDLGSGHNRGKVVITV